MSQAARLITTFKADLFPTRDLLDSFHMTEQNFGPYRRAVRSGRLTEEILARKDFAEIADIIDAPIPSEPDKAWVQSVSP